MRKLRLVVEELAVESFQPAAAKGGGGTVEGAEISAPFTCFTDEYPSCEGSCESCANCGGSGWTCDDTCWASCASCGALTCDWTCEGRDTCFPAEC
jgi:hypothetical protein